jgi:hypothetical protein
MLACCRTSVLPRPMSGAKRVARTGSAEHDAARSGMVRSQARKSAGLMLKPALFVF